MVLDDFAESLDRLSRIDPSALADTESMVSLHRDLARLEAIVTQATAAFDAAGNWVPDGALTAGAWITATCRVPRGEARRRVHRGRELRFFPETTRAWAHGEITGAHVDVMISLRGPETEAALARDEALLVDQARKLTFAHFTRAAAYWKQLADPDGADQDAERRRARRDVYLVQSFGGSWLGAMNLDPLTGTIVAEELDRLEHRTVRGRPGRGPRGPRPGSGTRRPPGPHPRTAPGRRPGGDGHPLEEHARTTPEGRPRCLPSWSGGRRCTGGSANWRTAPWSPRGQCCRGWTGPIWSGPCSPPAAGSRSAPPTGCSPGPPAGPSRYATNSAPTPSATWSLRRSQVDHIQPWALGGLTTQENGRLLCSFHNRLRNQRPPPAAAA